MSVRACVLACVHAYMFFHAYVCMHANVWLSVWLKGAWCLCAIFMCRSQDVMATPIPGDTDFLMVEVDGQFGKVPATYIQLL